MIFFYWLIKKKYILYLFSTDKYKHFSYYAYEFNKVYLFINNEKISNFSKGNLKLNY